jgi:hypothetical protein
MFRYFTIAFIFCSVALKAQIPTSTFESSGGTQNATLKEVTNFYQKAALNYPLKISALKSLPITNVLGTCYVLGQQKPDSTTCTILINNAIHAGEPDGVDACMLLVRDYLKGNFKLNSKVRIIIVPVFNRAGYLNRSSTSRANQNGPEEYGFRANAQNLDLNRDFMKADAPETKALQYLLVHEKPTIFLDTHVSDGADYQHIITLLVSQHNKMEKPLDEYVSNIMVPELFNKMASKNYALSPYVNHFEETPDNGWQEFYDSPRFASGFATLFNIIPLVVETHMLKSYQQRVTATLELLKTTIDYAGTNAAEIIKVKKASQQSMQNRKQFYFNWKCDTTQFNYIFFQGFTAGHKPSAISGQPRLFYDRDKPYIKSVKFFNQYQPLDFVTAPDAYIIPAAWFENNATTFSLLKSEWGTFEKFSSDTLLELEVYHLLNFTTVKKPYEGHYLHTDTKVESQKKLVHVRAGDYIFRLSSKQNSKQAAIFKRYLLELLEPTAPDSWFNWNGCDAVLQQKEGYSDYVFEDLATKYLQEHPSVQKELETLKLKDTVFAKDGAAQLDWVYKHSPWYEKTVNRYPIYRWVYKK